MYFKEPATKAQAVVIWLHGLGSNPQDMEGLAGELDCTVAIRHIFLAAPIRPVTINNGYEMPAWYDIYGMSFQDREDIVGITQSQQLLHKVIEQQIADDIPSHHIYLAGFSQGAAVALFSGLSFHTSLGGLLVLSGYLPCQTQLQVQQAKTLPIFFAVGQYDDMVLPQWSQQSVLSVQKMGFEHIHIKEYPMGHSVCAQEISDMSVWLNTHIKAQSSSGSEVS
jgi:phospholipase/carboxylesterase